MIKIIKKNTTQVSYGSSCKELYEKINDLENKDIGKKDILASYFDLGEKYFFASSQFDKQMFKSRKAIVPVRFLKLCIIVFRVTEIANSVSFQQRLPTKYLYLETHLYSPRRRLHSYRVRHDNFPVLVERSVALHPFAIADNETMSLPFSVASDHRVSGLTLLILEVEQTYRNERESCERASKSQLNRNIDKVYKGEGETLYHARSYENLRLGNCTFVDKI
ncbi:hypothetical protein WN51_09317 [Melipona quadrifasciata]|uniref:Uncharacterized protein n=1 Tax=Melipona quadrifasciata TaxID=166423 RepID=A0A0N0U6F4_9HYME|nr:hypothetical protein WN51_09317 [Melipona quadrifasciata]